MRNLTSTFRQFSQAFWISNIIELFERWAWYGFYMAFALYLTGTIETGALGFSAAEKGAIMGTGSMLLYLLPIFTGAIADRVGYKPMLLLSFTMYIAGYWMVGSFNSFSGVFLAYLFLATAGAVFKPIISAMISKTTTDNTSSIGFGIFYMMVNIGGFIGPFVVGAIYQTNWDYVFYISMGTVALNYIFVIFWFKEPKTESSPTTGLIGVFAQSIQNIFTTLTNWKYVLFLVIMVAFWTAFNQLYYAFPVFVDDWVQTASLYNWLYRVWPWLALQIGTANGTISAVTISSLDSFFIIGFQIVISALVMRIKPLNAMMTGILILAIGLYLMFSTKVGIWIVVGVWVFSIGEMASSPKFTEYVGRIAPADQKALYMGTSFLPIALSHSIAGWLSGDIFEHTAGKFYLLQQEMTQRGISIAPHLTQSEYWQQASQQTGLSVGEMTQHLWESYQPSKIWMLYAGIAVGAVVALFLYDKLILSRK